MDYVWGNNGKFSDLKFLMKNPQFFENCTTRFVVTKEVRPRGHPFRVNIYRTGFVTKF